MQGGSDISPADGAEEVRKLYPEGAAYEAIPVDMSQKSLESWKGIIGYRAIIKRTERAIDILSKNCSDKVFTIDGSCDADLASVAYAAHRYDGDLAVLWMDAYGDLNSQEESQIRLFYGMPVRALLGGCADELASFIGKPLFPRQIINI